MAILAQPIATGFDARLRLQCFDQGTSLVTIVVAVHKAMFDCA